MLRRDREDERKSPVEQGCLPRLHPFTFHYIKSLSGHTEITCIPYSYSQWIGQ